MRLHRLWIRAFGPFAGEEEVDFDSLAGGGLFLLHGPTGSGKTSVLDAVCFALYGTVPGSRAGAGRLRSDHAPPAVGAAVRCEFSVGPRRFEVTRSPAWERAKKRGSGTTTEQARVLVRERVGEAWQPRTQRIDEASDLLGSVLGLAADQFTKLVLLPQGEFAAFLRADAEARRQLLDRLFHADRFHAVQDWLRDHQLGLRRQVESAEQTTGRLIARAEQAASAAGSEPPSPTDGAAGQDRLAAVAGLRAGVGREWEDALARRAAAQVRLSRARRDREHGQGLADRQREADELVARLAALDAAAGVQDDRRRRLGAAERAAALGPLAPALAAATDRFAAAGSALRAAERELTEADPGIIDSADDTLAAAAVAAREEVGHLAGLEGTVAEVASVRERLAALRAAAAEAAARRQQADADRSRLDALTGRMREELAAALARARARDGLATAERAAELAAHAAAERDRREQDVREQSGLRDDARAAREDARQHWLDLRESRLQGFAAELAGRLGDGEACPVCGSPDHPSPASGEGLRVTEADEHAAREVLDGAEAALSAAEESLQEARAALAAARRASGGLAASAAAERLATATAAREEAERSAGEALELGDRIEGAKRQLAEATARAAAAVAQAHAGEEELASAGALERALVERLDAARGADPSVTARRRRLEARTEALEALLGARRDLAAATVLHAEVLAAAEEAARDAGFADVAEAVAAVLPEADRRALREAIAQHDADRAAATGRLDIEAIAAARAEPRPDLRALVTAEELASSDEAEAAGRVALCENAAGALDAIAVQLRAHLEATGPLVERHRVVNDLFRCSEGTGGDNLRRMSLSAYVLAARLEQVAAAASIRLREMSGGRYELVHSDATERGRGRSGLGVQVVDAWTGQCRETATLSGGEAFYTSLALALGLADVVSAEAGGTAIETLFVDEGFGSLDEQTLEDVMGVLDGLRCGGRAIGLVSHVPELRTRIPSRLEVLRHRDGSRLRQVSA
jgi:exonuclease SbcC